MWIIIFVSNTLIFFLLQLKIIFCMISHILQQYNFPLIIVFCKRLYIDESLISQYFNGTFPLDSIGIPNSSILNPLATYKRQTKSF